jgi:hypothetical protein
MAGLELIAIVTALAQDVPPKGEAHLEVSINI